MSPSLVFIVAVDTSVLLRGRGGGRWWLPEDPELRDADVRPGRRRLRDPQEQRPVLARPAADDDARRRALADAPLVGEVRPAGVEDVRRRGGAVAGVDLDPEPRRGRADLDRPDPAPAPEVHRVAEAHDGSVGRGLDEPRREPLAVER